jgi:hypothetical protein
MIETLLSFAIFITNPVGMPENLGYPVVTYEKFVEPGDKAPRSYTSQEACYERLTQVRKIALDQMDRMAVMPEYRLVMRERAFSLRCLPEDAKPAGRLARQKPPPSFQWRIGKLDPKGNFQGQNMDTRSYATGAACQVAYSSLVAAYSRYADGHGWDMPRIQQWRNQFYKDYRCMLAYPDDGPWEKKPPRSVLSPPMS